MTDESIPKEGEPAGSPSCTHSSCAWITLRLPPDLTPPDADSISYECSADPGGAFHIGTIEPGTTYLPQACAFGTPGTRVRIWIIVDYANSAHSDLVASSKQVVPSNEIIW